MMPSVAAYESDFESQPGRTGKWPQKVVTRPIRLQGQALPVVDWSAAQAARWTDESGPRLRAVLPKKTSPKAARRTATTPAGRWLLARVESQPYWIVSRGIGAAVFLSALCGLASILAPVLAAIGAASVFVTIGLAALLDFAVRGVAVMNLRVATLLLVSGCGSFVVLLVAIVS